MSTSPPVVPNLQECFDGFGFDGGVIGKLDGLRMFKGDIM